VRLTQAMNDFDLGRGRGDYPGILRKIRQPAVIVSISSDLLYPPHEQQLLARYLPNAEHALLHSPDGHDGFLIECGKLAGIITEFRQARTSGAAAKAGWVRQLSAVAE
jgi:homoserine O-acetyltransferase